MSVARGRSQPIRKRRKQEPRTDLLPRIVVENRQQRLLLRRRALDSLHRPKVGLHLCEDPLLPQLGRPIGFSDRSSTPDGRLGGREFLPLQLLHLVLRTERGLPKAAEESRSSESRWRAGGGWSAGRWRRGRGCAVGGGGGHRADAGLAELVAAHLAEERRAERAWT